MRPIFTLSLLATILISTIATPAQADKPQLTIELFGAKTPTDSRAAWTTIGESPKTDTAALWQHRDEVLVIKSGDKGYLRTKEDFTNFVLKLEWRRPKDRRPKDREPGRGGVLIRVTGKDKIWPKSLEAQINAGGVGDFWGLGGYRLTGSPSRFKQLQHEQFGTLRNLQKIEDAEKAVGQWNTYEIIANGENVTLKLNGKVVNRATGCDVVAGKICLTAEGDEIHFRNVRLSPLRSAGTAETR